MNRPNVFEFLANVGNGDSESDVSDDDEENATISDYSSAEDEMDVEDEGDNVAGATYVSKNGNMEWNSHRNNIGRLNAANILRDRNSGPAPHVNPADLHASFSYFFTDDMLDKIVLHTNQEAERQIAAGLVSAESAELWYEVTRQELSAFIGILLVMGALRGGMERLQDFWHPIFGQNSVIATMSRNRFQAIIRYLRFDDRATRVERRALCKLAPISELWNLFIRNSKRSIIASAYVCVDEQIVSTRGRCPFRVYMANKPHKYGIKIWVLADQDGFFLDGEVYLGREQNGGEVNQGHRVVTQLCAPYYGSGRNVTMDSFFTSVPLANTLSENGMSMLGTLNKSKGEIPREFVARREHMSSVFGYNGTKQLCSYMAKPTKCVITLSTLNTTSDTDPNPPHKPHTILDYNQMKYPVDVVDQMVNTFSTRRKTRRWPLLMFFHITDLCALNAYLIWVKRHPNWKLAQSVHRRSIYLKELALELMIPWMQQRLVNQPASAMRAHVKRAREACGVNLEPDVPIPDQAEVGDRVRRSCAVCLEQHRRHRQINTQCSRCHRHICLAHTIRVCQRCQ